MGLHIGVLPLCTLLTCLVACQTERSESQTRETSELPLSELRALAQKGDADAHPQDYQEEAVKLIHLAADQGDANAQFNLGVMYDQGQGVPQDYQQAVKWYRLAADQGHASALRLLNRAK